jgi:hypothetical protein
MNESDADEFNRNLPLLNSSSSRGRGHHGSTGQYHRGGGDYRDRDRGGHYHREYRGGHRGGKSPRKEKDTSTMSTTSAVPDVRPRILLKAVPIPASIPSSNDSQTATTPTTTTGTGTVSSTNETKEIKHIRVVARPPPSPTATTPSSSSSLANRTPLVTSSVTSSSSSVSTVRASPSASPTASRTQSPVGRSVTPSSTPTTSTVGISTVASQPPISEEKKDDSNTDSQPQSRISKLLTNRLRFTPEALDKVTHSSCSFLPIIMMIDI